MPDTFSLVRQVNAWHGMVRGSGEVVAYGRWGSKRRLQL